VVVGCALVSGAARWRLRASRLSFSGAVVCVGFRSFPQASAFASSFGWWCGCSLAVRRFSGGLWGVSVPVSAPAGCRSLAAPLPARLPASVWVARG
jgi:hypothetical protein